MPVSQFSSSRPTWQHVLNPQAARLLTNMTELRLLEPLFGGPLSVTELARTLNLPLDALYFRVRRAEKLGLLRVASVQKRHGSAVKRYGLSASGFFVPQDVIPDVSFAQLALELDLFMEQHLMATVLSCRHAEAHTGEFGLRIYRSERNHLTVEPAFSAGDPFNYLALKETAVYSMWSEVHLTFDEALALRSQLDALRREKEHSAGTQKYLLRLALAPLER